MKSMIWIAAGLLSFTAQTQLFAGSEEECRPLERRGDMSYYECLERGNVKEEVAQAPDYSQGIRRNQISLSFNAARGIYEIGLPQLNRRYEVVDSLEVTPAELPALFKLADNDLVFRVASEKCHDSPVASLDPPQICSYTLERAF